MMTMMVNFFAFDQFKGSLGSSDLALSDSMASVVDGNLRLGDEDDVCILARAMLQASSSL